MDEATKQLVLDYQWLFATEQGKRVRADLRSRFDCRIIPTGIPEQLACAVGKRDVYLYIIDKLEADPNAETQDKMETEED